MDQFERFDISYKPTQIGVEIVTDSEAASTIETESVAVAEKLLKHLQIIDEFKERLKAIDYLCDSAAKLAGNIKYKVPNDSLVADISAMNGSGDIVDFELFKRAVDVVIQSYEQQALVAITGAANAGR